MPTRSINALFALIVTIFVGSLLSPHGQAQRQNPIERKVTERVAPFYPPLARRLHIGGTVKVEVVVRRNGTVKSTKVLGGNPVLIDSAVDAVRKWKFEAATEESTVVVEISFEKQES